MCKFPILDYYADSRKRQVSVSTNAHSVEVLTRIFDQITKDYPVSMRVEKISDAYSKYRIEGLDGDVLQHWYNANCEGHKAATVNNYVCMLGPFLRWAYGLHILPEDLSNVLHCVRLPSVDSLPEDERPKDKYITHEQANALLNTTTGYNRTRDRAIIALILYSGLRISELCSLTVGMMQKRDQPITVKRKGGKYVPVVIGEGFWPYLDAYMRTRPDAKPEDPLFVTTHGTPCNRQQLWKVLSFKQEDLGLATGPHALRHTFVSEVENTAGAGVARDCANHKSLAITNRYDHTTKEQRQAAVDRLSWA